MVTVTPTCIGALSPSDWQDPTLLYSGSHAIPCAGSRLPFLSANKISGKNSADQFMGRGQRRSMTQKGNVRHRVLMGNIPEGQTGGKGINESWEEMKERLLGRGACVWVVMAALGTEGWVSEAALSLTCLLHFSKPQSPAWGFPAKADRNPPHYQYCHLTWTCRQCCEFQRGCLEESYLFSQP